MLKVRELMVNIPDYYQYLLNVTDSKNPALEPYQSSLKSLTQPGSPSFLVMRNLPIDRPLLEPPQDGKRPASKTTWISEATLFSIQRMVGLQPLSYLQEKGGVLVHEVAPVPGLDKSLSNSGVVALGFHTDDSILKPEFRPEFLTLLGLINEHHTPTFIAPIDWAFAELSSRHQRELMKPQYRVESPDSFKIFGGKVLRSELRSLVTRNDSGDLEIAGNLYAVTTGEPQAQVALDSLRTVLPEIAESVVLEPGCAVIFSNSRVLHGRAAITGGKRWLQRCFSRKNLDALRKATGNYDTHSFDIQQLILA
ncbi:MAG: TauD/TfdA family dioxygenase [Cyanobacteria bacterium P01_H01_bin.35]